MKTIYHYCSAEAFLQILQTGRLWVSDARKTNDRRELEVFNDLARAHIEELAKTDGAVRMFASQLEFHFAAVQGISDYYVCCFSEDADSVPQWVAYADRGSGFAIGFDVNAVRMDIGAPELDLSYREIDFEAPRSRWLFGPAIYAEEKTGPLLKGLAKLITHGHQLGTGPVRDYIDRLCAFCKDSSFASEQEWRIIYNSSDSIAQLLGGEEPHSGVRPEQLWRHGRYGLTPYIVTPDLRSCIREVVIGPSNKDSGSDTYIHQFLQSINVQCDVRRSNSPYR